LDGSRTEALTIIEHNHLPSYHFLFLIPPLLCGRDRYSTISILLCQSIIHQSPNHSSIY